LGMKEGDRKIDAAVDNAGVSVNGWRVSSFFGDSAFFNGDWLKRAAGAKAGIYGNDSVEAAYPLGKFDAEGRPLDGSKYKYTLTFAAGQFPPVNAFWSVTMYDGKTQLLIKNPIDRYLINSPMLPDLKKNADGSLTVYIQKDEPTDPVQKANWLPAPDGPIYIVMRLYWPKEAALNGKWQPPGIKVAK
jgi:hypothetical protein